MNEDYNDDDSQPEIKKQPKEKISTVEKRNSFCAKNYQGILLAIVSSFTFPVSAVLVKKLENYDPLNIAQYKFLGALLPAIPLLLQKIYWSKKGPAIVEQVWPLTEQKKLKLFGFVLLRSFLACNAFLLHYHSLQYLSIGDALAISAACPLFVCIFGKIFLGEECGWPEFIASMLSMIGVLAIAKPPVLYGSEEINMKLLIGSSSAFASTIVAAIALTILRHIRQVHYSVTTIMFGGWGLFECVILVFLIPGLKIPSGVYEWGLVIGLAIFTLFGQVAIILAMKTEQAGPVAIVRSLNVLFGYIFELLLWKVPDGISLVGAAIITVSVIYVGIWKWKGGNNKDDPVKEELPLMIKQPCNG